MEPYTSIERIKIALVICLTVALISMFFIKDEACLEQPAEIFTVSGYYGPGAYLAFLATSLSSILGYEWLRPLRLLRAFLKKDRAQNDRQLHSLQAKVFKEEMPSPFDAAYIGMMAYVAIAWGDLSARGFRENYNVNTAEVAASVMIIRRSFSLLASIAICGIAIDSLLFQGGTVDYSITRHLLWVVNQGAGRHTWYLLDIFDNASSGSFIMLMSVAFAAMITVLTLTMMRKAPLFGLLFQPCLLILSLWVQASTPLRVCEDCPTVYRSIFPVSSSSLSDLDQAAALATGLLVALWPLVTPDIRRDLWLSSQRDHPHRETQNAR